MAQVEDHGERLVFLRVGCEEVQEEALAAAGRPEHQRVPDVLHMEVVVVRRLVPRFEHGERLAAAEGRRGPLALVETEEKAEIGAVRLQQGEAPQVVRAVAGHDGRPGVEQVIALEMEAAVVGGEHLEGLGGRAVLRAAIVAEQHEGQRTLAKEMAADLELRQRVPELADDGAGALVHQHLFRPRLRAEVVHHRDPPVVVMPATCLEIAPHAIVPKALPLEARDELARHGVEVFEHVRERRARWLLHREHLDARFADLEMRAKALQRRVGDEEVEVGVVGQARGLGDCGVVVHEASKESERLVLGEAHGADGVGQVHLERPRLLMQLRDGARHVFFQQRDDGTGREPGAQRRAWTAPRALDPRRHPGPLREALVHQHEEEVHLEQLAGLAR